jgi:hypothetical protein
MTLSPTGDRTDTGSVQAFSSRANGVPARVGLVGDVHACDEPLALLRPSP